MALIGKNLSQEQPLEWLAGYLLIAQEEPQIFQDLYTVVVEQQWVDSTPPLTRLYFPLILL